MLTHSYQVVSPPVKVVLFNFTVAVNVEAVKQGGNLLGKKVHCESRLEAVKISKFGALENTI